MLKSRQRESRRRFGETFLDASAYPVAPRGRDGRPSRTERALIGVRRLLLLLVVILAACSSGPDVSHYTAVLNGLKIPAGWELIHTTIRRPGGPHREIQPGRPSDEIQCDATFGACPTVTRYYLVAGRPVDAFPKGKQVIVDAGFQVASEFGPNCRLLPSSPACGLTAVRDSDLIDMTLYNPGDDFDGVGVAARGRSLIRIVAEGK